jgi:3-hydroxyisobutyrate dehydrogenase
MDQPGHGSKIAVLGLGAMGFGMASSLCRNGFAVAGFDVQPEVTRRFAEETAGVAAASARAAVQDATAVVVVVVNADQTEALLVGADGVAQAMQPGAVILSCATMAPERARGLAAAVQGMGLDYLDCPISGGAQRAAQGALTVLASGAPAAMAKAEPVLAAIAATVYRLGDEAGTGAAFKMVNQLLAGVHIAAAAEAMVFAKRLGLDLRKVYEVITASAGNSWMFENRMPHVLDGDYAPRSAVDIFTKDLGIVSDMARGAKFPTPVASAALQMFLMTAAAGMGRDDDASVARLYASISGLDLPGKS